MENNCVDCDKKCGINTCSYSEEDERVRKKCICLQKGVQSESCKHYLDYPEDFNCVLCTVERNPDGMTCEEIAKRFPFTKQYVDIVLKKAFSKLKIKVLSNSDEFDI